MSNVFSEQMEQDYYDELFMQDAAKMVDAGLLDDLKASQDLEVDEKWLQNLKRNTTKRLGFKKVFWRTIRCTKRIGRIAAIFFLTVCIVFGSIYMTVDAARETINNFLLGKANHKNAIISPAFLDEEAYALIPLDWTGPVYATWMPDGYKLASSGTQSDQYWWLVYNVKENIMQSICIYIWDNNYKPIIDVESYEIVSESTILEVPATVFHDTKHDVYTLIMIKNNLTIQIIGTINHANIVEIAEKLVF